METVVLDCEIYANYFLVAFKHLATSKIVRFERTPDVEFDTDKVRRILNRYELVSFNGINFDIPLIQLAMTGADNATLLEACEGIIKGGLRPWDFKRKHNIHIPEYNHIDIMEVAKGRVGLKLYAGRLNAKRLTNLPIAPGSTLSRAEMDTVAEYCGFDLDLTELVYKKLIPQIGVRVELTKQYGQELRSKSDAQIAEAVLKSELAKLGICVEKPTNIGWEFSYSPPAYLRFDNEELAALLNDLRGTTFMLKSTGKFATPDCLKKGITIGDSKYTLGIGGLHSNEKDVDYAATKDIRIVDRDVASYYPRIILNERLFPPHIGEEFLTVYNKIVNDRLRAKRSKNSVVAECLKIVINGSFGKFGSIYSALFSPEILLMVTLTGQLSLLMLIERLEAAGIRCVSANTDGVVMLVPKSSNDTYDIIVHDWEIACGFETEETEYSRYTARDVNNYVAIKKDGLSVKTKGVFGTSVSLDKSPDCPIIYDAVIEALVFDIDISTYIRECTDITRFIALRTVNGGAVADGVNYGKVVRWYYSSECRGGTISYAINGHKVPKSEGGKVCMLLPEELPDDIDYDVYITAASDLFTKLTTSNNLC